MNILFGYYRRLQLCGVLCLLHSMYHVALGEFNISITAPSTVGILEPLNVSCTVRLISQKISDIATIAIVREPLNTRQSKKESIDVLKNAALDTSLRTEVCGRYNLSATASENYRVIQLTFMIEQAFTIDMAQYRCEVRVLSGNENDKHPSSSNKTVLVKGNDELERNMTKECEAALTTAATTRIETTTSLEETTVRTSNPPSKQRRALGLPGLSQNGRPKPGPWPDTTEDVAFANTQEALRSSGHVAQSLFLVPLCIGLFAITLSKASWDI